MQNEVRGGSQSFRPDWRAARAGPDIEAMPADPVSESPSARRPVEESTTTADGVGGREWMVTTVADATETLGAMMGAAKPSEVGA